MNVHLEQHVGGDLSVVAAARTSYKAEWPSWRGMPDERLINFLMEHRHGTPFEHNLFTFSVHAPIFVAREWFRHRIGSFNEFSQRYAEVKEEFFKPLRWRKPDPNNKQGSVVPEMDMDISKWEWYNNNILYMANEDAYNRYKQLIDRGVAREQARMVLPLSTYTDFVWSVNARSLMNFLELRRAPNAQQEIRDYTPELEELFRQEMPVTYEAFAKHGFVAP